MSIERLLATVLLWAAACAGASAAEYGILKMDGEGKALLITAKRPDPSATLLVQYPDAESRPVCCKHLRAADLVPVGKGEAVAINKLSGVEPLLYRVPVPREWTDMPFIGIAAWGQPSRVRNGRDGQLEASDRHGGKSRASLCTSSEGVHLLEPASGRKRQKTHLYLWLGYEIESPTCKAGQVK
ncbi:hypothetical protein G8A07_18795 [Roseateles sp. DAIF2]|uniref:hypothetical protein n=1 Tax=Roseateles sp. DAIF2 TaxID=2714952 RepID=UPI0018A27E3E|nr:hypothetical protein [Roseateles sp. DAIF2]QPF74766.1 hypothetical protein G8A07_18795 [Roseateles sp. DAIF2]